MAQGDGLDDEIVEMISKKPRRVKIDEQPQEQIVMDNELDRDLSEIDDNLDLLETVTNLRRSLQKAVMKYKVILKKLLQDEAAVRSCIKQCEELNVDYSVIRKAKLHKMVRMLTENHSSEIDHDIIVRANIIKSNWDKLALKNHNAENKTNSPIA